MTDHMTAESDLLGPLIETRHIARGPLSWALNEGPDGHWTNTFVVHDAEGQYLAECEYRPFAELLVEAHNRLGDLLDLVEEVRALPPEGPALDDELSGVRAALAALDEHA